MQDIEGFKLLSREKRCTFIGQKWRQTYKIKLPNALYVKRQSMIERSNVVCSNHCQYQLPCISMDFIFGLPNFIHGNKGIWTIVDWFSKQAHFIPIKKTIKAHHMATLFIAQVFKYHGLPTSIVSNRDPRMTSSVWKGLFENLGTNLNFSLAYHPQIDGQSEIANFDYHWST